MRDCLTRRQSVNVPLIKETPDTEPEPLPEPVADVAPPEAPEEPAWSLPDPCRS